MMEMMVFLFFITMLRATTCTGREQYLDVHVVHFTPDWFFQGEN